MCAKVLPTEYMILAPETEVLPLEPKVLPVEPKVLQPEPKVLPFGAKSTATGATYFWPEMLLENIQTFLVKMKPRGSYGISKGTFMQILIFGWSVSLTEDEQKE